jgi:hypothetical protein
VLDAAAVLHDGTEETPPSEELAQIHAFLADAEGAAEIVAATVALGKPQAPPPALGESGH